MQKIIAGSFFVVLLLFFVPGIAFAQTAGLNLTLSPTYLTVRTDPGEKVTGQFSVKNNSNVAEQLTLSLSKFTTGEKGIVLSDMESGDEYASWVSFSEESFSLVPNQTKKITVTITPSKTAALGYYYAVVVRREKSEQTSGVGASVSGAAAIPLLLEVVSPSAKREMQIVDVKTSAFVYEYLPADVQITVKNTGNVHVVPFGSVFLDGMGQKEIGILAINEGRGNVLPGANRTFNSVWNDGFAVLVEKLQNGKVVKDEKGHSVMDTKFDFSKADRFRIGKYTARVLLAYDNGERDIPLAAEVSFWVFPWKIVLGIGVVSLLAVVGVYSVFIAPLLRKVRKSSK